MEATPAESTSYRFAKHDVEKYPDIITASRNGDAPYYTNSSHLPVGYTDDIFTALDIQDRFQTLYTSGTVFHAFLGEKLPDWRSAAKLVKKIAENYELPYYTLSPTYSICQNHGYIAGEVHRCPKCGAETEVWSRITGYYRPVKNWNTGKAEEFKERKTYNIATSVLTHERKSLDEPLAKNVGKLSGRESVMLFTTSTCPNCKIAKSLLDKAGLSYEVVDAEKVPELAVRYEVMQAPTLVVARESGDDSSYVGVSEIKNFISLAI